MMMMNKTYVGNAILLLSFVFWMWVSITIMEVYGEWIGTQGLFPAFILLSVLVIFLSRFSVEWVVNKLWP